MHSNSENPKRPLVRRQVAAAGMFVLAVILKMVDLGWRSTGLESRAQLATAANKTVNPDAIYDYGYALLAVVTVASLIALLLFFKPIRRLTGLALSAVLQRVADLLAGGGAIVSAVCFAIAYHVGKHPSVAPAAGELTLRGYVYYGCGFAVAFSSMPKPSGTCAEAWKLGAGGQRFDHLQAVIMRQCAGR